MDPSMIQRALMAIRGQSGQGGQDASAGMPSAPMPMNPGLDQAFGQPAAPSLQQQGKPTMGFDPALENQVQQQGGNTGLEPIVQQIMKHLGMMSMIRNRSNQLMDPTAQG